ncbi:MAG: hypothetical protein COT26_01575 [Candidatus Kerfeldbacteria bacterium CG08_land_8_20_14_0_20_43_14]|uniref:Uncharacterized protein n=1 Tax=Candidatus Kerfeldbacteria bacterium CG08_land_8_20_14_0_20_43_14 TaxID=2014246 RepID=A0A2H0YSM9_9BACT|nr:MAG: hypothetical protein COT26_01575 [Candidatus Kerfeldbacteria bacterium CG08_land_8_20_14_0_20_43_14]
MKAAPRRMAVAEPCGSNPMGVQVSPAAPAFAPLGLRPSPTEVGYGRRRSAGKPLKKSKY